MPFNSDYLKEICKNCGFTLGSHLATRSGGYPKDYCPGTEGEMDWDKGPGTVFAGSGKYKEDPNVSSH